MNIVNARSGIVVGCSQAAAEKPSQRRRRARRRIASIRRRLPPPIARAAGSLFDRLRFSVASNNQAMLNGARSQELNALKFAGRKDFRHAWRHVNLRGSPRLEGEGQLDSHGHSSPTMIRVFAYRLDSAAAPGSISAAVGSRCGRVPPGVQSLSFEA